MSDNLKNRKIIILLSITALVCRAVYCIGYFFSYEGSAAVMRFRIPNTMNLIHLMLTMIVSILLIICISVKSNHAIFATIMFTISISSVINFINYCISPSFNMEYKLIINAIIAVVFAFASIIKLIKPAKKHSP